LRLCHAGGYGASFDDKNDVKTPDLHTKPPSLWMIRIADFREEHIISTVRKRRPKLVMKKAPARYLQKNV
jgi:hypothetical protein